MINNLQILRGVAAVLVVICHSSGQIGPHPYLERYLFSMGQAGVDIFFVISGFVIGTVSLRDAEKAPWPISAALFAHARVGRIFPIYWVVLTLSLIASWATTGSPTEGSRVTLMELYTLQGFGPSLGVAWTLVYEMYFYLLVAGLLLVSGRHAGRLLLPAAALYGFIIIAAAVAGQRGEFWLSPVILEFLFGVVLSLVARRGIRVLAWPALVLGVVGIAVAGHFMIGSPNMALYRPLVYGLPAMFLVYGAVSLEGKLPTPAWAILIGDASYSIYLSHGAIMHQVRILDFKPFPSLLGAAAFIVGLTLIGVALYWFVERHLISWARSVRRDLTAAHQAA